MDLHIFWLLWISAVTLVISFNYALLKYYTDPHESVKLSLLIQVLAFSSVMVYILLIPFDVFAAVRHFEGIIQFRLFHHAFNLKIYDLYFLCYLCMICLVFVGLPFSYFYAQIVQDEEELSLRDDMPPMDSSESESEEEDNDDEQDKQPGLKRRFNNNKPSLGGNSSLTSSDTKKSKEGDLQKCW